MNEGRSLLVTGGSRGIGAATCLLAARSGWRVAVNYAQNADAAADVVARIKAVGGEAFALQGDVAMEADIVSMFAEVEQRFGRVDGLVNNAGIVAPRSRVEHMDAGRLERMVRVNLIGTMIASREAVKRMSTARGGRGGTIVNVSSVAARLGSPDEYVDYAAAKAGVETFTVGLAREVALEGIRVNCVRPGTIDTEIHASGGQPDRAQRVSSAIPMRRPGTAEEIASAICYFLSDAASYSTGAILDVAGGR
jgi:NAD(P)-dependent dehydrogenase (short-subunit alcohol dehydrogenase family)